MGQKISDRDIARVLYTATGLIDPVLGAIEDWDVGGLKRATFTPPGDDDSMLSTLAHAVISVTDHVGAPGTRRWDAQTVDQRTSWWVDRIGSLSTVLVAFPGIYGAAADRLPIQDLLGFAHQAFIICAVQRVHGVDDRHRQTDQLAAVLCDRVIDSAALLAATPQAQPGSDKSRIRTMTSPRELVRAVWDVVRLLRSITGELSHRPSPRAPWRLLSAVPVVGAVADYLGERGALQRAAEATTASLQAPVGV